MWDIQRGACVRLFPNQGGTIYALAISPDGRTLACGGQLFSFFLFVFLDHSVLLIDHNF